MSPDNRLEELAKRIDEQMRDHAYSHKISNSPYDFYCSPSCVSQHLQVVVEREAKPMLQIDQEVMAVLQRKLPGWDGTPDHLDLLFSAILR